MVLDGEVLIAVTSGDVDAVKAWLAADPCWVGRNIVRRQTDPCQHARTSHDHRLLHVPLHAGGNVPVVVLNTLGSHSLLPLAKPRLG